MRKHAAGENTLRTEVPRVPRGLGRDELLHALLLHALRRDRRTSSTWPAGLQYTAGLLLGTLAPNLVGWAGACCLVHFYLTKDCGAAAPAPLRPWPAHVAQGHDELALGGARGGREGSR